MPKPAESLGFSLCGFTLVQTKSKTALAFSIGIYLTVSTSGVIEIVGLCFFGVIDKKQFEATGHATTSPQAQDSSMQSSDEPLEAGPQETSFERQYCVFRAGRERFCLSVLQMEEVVEWPAVTPVPLSPAFLMGVFNLRGAIVPVIDIAFAEGRRPDLKPRHVVVAALQPEPGQEVMRLGIAADEVIGTFAASEPLQVKDAPRELSHCCGMLRHETDRLALALDLKRLAGAFSVGVI